MSTNIRCPDAFKDYKLDDERVIKSFTSGRDCLIVSDKRLVKVRKSLLGAINFEDISLNAVDAIVYNKKFFGKKIIVGLGLMLASLLTFLIGAEGSFDAAGPLGVIFLLVGIVILILGFIGSKKILFKSPSHVINFSYVDANLLSVIRENQEVVTRQ